MGQYYKPINLDKKEWLYSHNYDNGLKLMEHSYIGNNFVSAVENLLIEGGSWYKNRIVWAGDYADVEKGTITKENKEGENLYSKIGIEENEIKPEGKELPPEYKYLVNHTLKVYVNRSKIKAKKGELKINPLPLLTCEGNGRGGGDFHGEDERIGEWARHIISIEKEIPKEYLLEDGTFFEE